MTSIEKNRVFNTNEIETLRTTAMKTFQTGSTSAQTWDEEIVTLRALLGSAKVKSPALTGALDGITGNLYNPDWEEHGAWADNALGFVSQEIPQQDAAGVALFEPLYENLQYVTGMIEELATCIDTAGTNIALAEFQGRIDDIKQNWDGTRIEENIDEFESKYLGIVDNVAYSEDIFSCIAGVTPKTLRNKLILEIYDTAALFSDISEDKVLQNASENEKFLEKADNLLTKSGYIENQLLWNNVKFGENDKSDMARSGCGIIATYNALYALGEDVSKQTMVELISHYERDGAVFGGFAGVSPGAIERYFINKGYDVITTSARNENIVNKIGEQTDTVIVTAYNDVNNLMEQIHTVSITKEDDGTYSVHNAYFLNDENEYASKDGFNTLYEATRYISSKNSAPISVIGIKDKLLSRE